MAEEGDAACWLAHVCDACGLLIVDEPHECRRPAKHSPSTDSTVVRSAGRLQVEVLGPIRALDAGDRDVTPAGSLQRRLLALLVLRRGRVVSMDSAFDVLWPAQLPADPAAALQNHMFRLRRRLPDGVIESVDEGYRLDPARIDLDVDRLSALLSAGATAHPKALAEIDTLLQRWQGPAYPELDDVDDGRAESVRLVELRSRAREVLAEGRLAIGDGDGLVAELAALVDDEPLRERPRALLMAALAATGRRAEALRVYDDFRRLLGAELGIEPSPLLANQHADLLAGAATGATAWAPAHRLPTPATSLIGREELVLEIVALAEVHRVVTLVGPGGVGKTRSLLEVGHRARAGRPHRPVVLCELATAEVDSAIDVVAAALDIDARPGVPLIQRLADVLGETDIVLLLDNCEHVLDPTAELVERLVTRCPNVRVVATSRERLRLPGEHVRAVPTLPTVDDDGPGVRLFVERARAVAPDFEPESTERARVAEIVRRLDGLPLAIELAAARLHTHDLADVATGLDRRFSLLSSGHRASPRHASLSAAVSWSFELLDDRLQQTFADMSVFAGSFTAADAAAICGTDDEAISAAIALLVERSLVMRAPHRRYVLLETLRAFGAEQLAATGRVVQLGERHARHQVDWIERVRLRLLAPDESVLAEIEFALPELRTALGWLLDHREVALAGRLVAALLDYGFYRLRPDVLAWAERVIEADPDDRSPMAPMMWAVAAYSAWMAGDVPETGVRSRRALDVAERDGSDPPSEVATIYADFELFEGRLDSAVEWYGRAAEAAVANPAQRLMVRATETLARAYAGDATAGEIAARLLEEIGDAPTPCAAYVWYCAGEADLATADIERARTRFTTAVELAERTHTSFVIGLAGASKASIDARFGDPVAAAADYRRLLDHWRRAGMWSTQWTMLRSVAGLLARLGRHRDAAVIEGAVRATDSGHRIFGADEIALNVLGAHLREALGDEDYELAHREGARLDGDAVVDHALRAL